MLIIGIVVTGMAIGGLAQLVLGRASTRIDWTMALVAGIGGAFVGGLLSSVLTGDGLALGPGGIVGSLVGAVIVTWLWLRIDAGKADEARIDRRRR